MAAAEPPHAPELRGPRWWVDAAGGLALGIEGTGAFEMHRHRAALAGLEARHPLLDLDLVELALSVAPERSFDRRHNRPLLRSAVTGVLPEAVRTRRAKARFDSLVVDTLAGPDGHAVRGLLADRHAELHAYVDLARAERALLRVRPPVEASFAWMQQVWRLVSAECWLRAQADPELARLPELLRPSAARVTLRPFSPLTCAGAPIRCSTYASPRKEGTWRSATPTRSPS
jgi:asparagine synthetase B (glutamine-hydrolysing)